MTGWCWFALVDGPLDGRAAATALASAAAADAGGAPVGLFAAWPAGGKPVASALRMDDALIDPGGPAVWVSLVTVPRRASPLFDDVAVSEALRQVLRGWPPRCGEHAGARRHHLRRIRHGRPHR